VAKKSIFNKKKCIFLTISTFQNLYLYIMASMRSLVSFLVTLQVLQGFVHCILNGFPCIQRFNQLYCVGKGLEYPTSAIDGYIDDNKALIRRMYGNLIQEEEVPPPKNPRTPASTLPLTPTRTVRNFAGKRFKRHVLEGFMEDLIIRDDEGEALEAEVDYAGQGAFWQDFVAANYEELFKSFNITGNDQEVLKELVSSAINRPKRQAGFPGATKENENSNLVDVCDSHVEVTTPYWATNSKGKVRAIVNNKQFEQAVHQEICGNSETPRCHRECRCEQKYKWHRLLAYDPNNGKCGGIFMDWFLFPSCCACRCQRNPLIDGPAKL